MGSAGISVEALGRHLALLRGYGTRWHRKRRRWWWWAVGLTANDNAIHQAHFYPSRNRGVYP